MASRASFHTLPDHDSFCPFRRISRTTVLSSIASSPYTWHILLYTTAAILPSSNWYNNQCLRNAICYRHCHMLHILPYVTSSQIFFANLILLEISCIYMLCIRNAIGQRFCSSQRYALCPLNWKFESQKTGSTFAHTHHATITYF